MTSLFFQSSFNPNPLCPQPSYQELESNYHVKQEPMELMDSLIPLVHYPYQFDNCPELDFEASLSDGANASNTSRSPLLTPKLDAEAESGAQGFSFDDNSGGEVDEDFINQISCFSNEDVKKVDVLNSCPVRQIFARSRPLVLLESPTETVEWIEYSGPVRIYGKTFEVSGWESSDKDDCLFTNVDLKGWESPRERKLSGGCVSDNASRTMDSSNSKPSTQTPIEEKKYYWGRRMTSNRHVPEGHKKRLEQEGDPDKVDQKLLEYDATLLRDTAESCFAQAMNTVSESTYPGRHKGASRLHIPSYIFPQPVIARLITKIAVEDEYQQALVNNVLLLGQYSAEAEVTRRLVNEFLDIPEDTKEEMMDFESSCGKPYSEAYAPSGRSSMATSGEIMPAIHPEGVPPRFSTSTRRRAISCKPQILDNAFKSADKISMDEWDSYVHQKLPIQRGFCASNVAELDTFLSRKHILNDDEITTEQRNAKRVRFQFAGVDSQIRC